MLQLQESQRQLILHSEFTALVFGKGEDFVLLRCNEPASDIEDARAAGQQGMVFCGVLALTQDGQLKADISPTNPSAVYTMTFAGLGFVHLVVDRLKQKPKGDAVEWLMRLFVQPDTRN